MTNEEILNGILKINLSGISKSLTEVLDQDYRHQISNTLRPITFYGYGSNQDAIECCKRVIEELQPILDKLEELDIIDLLKEQEKVVFFRERISKLHEIIYELEGKEILKNNEMKFADHFFEQEIDRLIATFPIKTQTILNHVEGYRDQLKSYIIFSSPEDIRMTASYREFFEDIFFPKLHPTDDIMEFPEFEKIIDSIHNTREIYKRADDPALDAIFSASSDRLIKKIHGGRAEKTDLEIMKERYFNNFLRNRNIAGTHFGLATLDGEIHSVIGIRLNNGSADIHIIHEIIHALFIFFAQGRPSTGFNQEYKNFNEIVTQWLAQLVAEVYFRDYPPAFSKEDNCSYNSAVNAVRNFLTLHKDDIIYALMENAPHLFISKIGEDTMKEIDRILGNYIKFHNVDHFENPHLKDDALWLYQLDQNAEHELSKKQ